MASLLGEIKRRKVFQVAATYAVVAWLLVQIVVTIEDPLSLPGWTDTLIIICLAIGFPITLILSWAFDLTADGLVRDESTPGTRPVAGRRLEYALIGLLAVAVAWVLYRVELNPPEQTAGLVVDFTPSGRLPNSVAVLPFENLSLDTDDAFFAAGIHEEILNQIAKLRSLSVISRTSVLRYEDSELSLPEIASELNVETIMEGSVRYADGRVLVTAQLIDPETDTHLWSNSYNRELVDVFGIQADIAMNIASALQAEFSAADRAKIGRVATRSATAYALYLESLQGEVGSARAIEMLNAAIALDPEFGLAHAAKALESTYHYFVGAGTRDPSEPAEFEQIIQESAETALALDPNLGMAHAALGALHQYNWRAIAAEEAFRRALDLSPNDVETMVWYGRFKRYRREFDEAIRIQQRAMELDPNNNNAVGQLALTYRSSGEWEETIAACRRFLENIQGGIGCRIAIANAESGRGDNVAAVQALQGAEERDPVPFRLAQIAYGYALADRPQDAMRVFESFQAAAMEETVGEAAWTQAYMAIGDYDQALQHLELAVANRVSTDFVTIAALAANAWGDPELASARFRALLDGLWIEE